MSFDLIISRSHLLMPIAYSDDQIKPPCNDFVKIAEVGFIKSLSMLRVCMGRDLSIHLPEETLIGIISGIKVYILAIQSKWQSLSISNSKVAEVTVAHLDYAYLDNREAFLSVFVS